MVLDNFCDGEEVVASGIGEALLLSSVAKRLTRKAATKDVECWNACDVDKGDVSFERDGFFEVGVDFFDVVEVGFSSIFVPFGCEYAGGTCVVKGVMEAADASEEVDEL